MAEWRQPLLRGIYKDPPLPSYRYRRSSQSVAVRKSFEPIISYLKQQEYQLSLDELNARRVVSKTRTP